MAYGQADEEHIGKLGTQIVVDSTDDGSKPYVAAATHRTSANGAHHIVQRMASLAQGVTGPHNLSLIALIKRPSSFQHDTALPLAMSKVNRFHNHSCFYASGLGGTQ